MELWEFYFQSQVDLISVSLKSTRRANLFNQRFIQTRSSSFGTTIDDALGDEVRITVVAAGFEGGEPKKVATPVIDAATLGGVADPIASNDPISCSYLDLGSETPKRRVDL